MVAYLLFVMLYLLPFIFRAFTIFKD